MSFSQSDIDALDIAIRSNVTEVRFQNRTVVYRSMQELMQARSLMVADTSGDSGTPIIRQSRIVTNKGW